MQSLGTRRSWQATLFYGGLARVEARSSSRQRRFTAQPGVSDAAQPPLGNTEHQQSTLKGWHNVSSLVEPFQVLGIPGCVTQVHSRFLGSVVSVLA